MKFKEFAIWPLFGLDVTPRKTYRYRLSLNKKAIDEYQKEIEKLTEQAKKTRQDVESLHDDWRASERANKELVAANQTLIDEAKRLECETKRQYKAYKALADRQEATEEELAEVIDAKKAVEQENDMLREQIQRLERKLQRFDRPRKKGRFSKPQPEPTFNPMEEVVEDAVEELVTELVAEEPVVDNAVVVE